MKKNVIAIVAAVALVLLAVPTIAFANGMQQTWCPSGGVGSLAHHAMRAAGQRRRRDGRRAIATVRGEYVDRNNDGVCDNYSVGKGANKPGSCAGYADADGDGIGDNCANGRGSCPAAHADGNGVCDNYANGCGNGRAGSATVAATATAAVPATSRRRRWHLR
ncbi:MAG: hypothetical protein ACLSVD_13730 [Eggerthellaceae bacterium]